MIHIERSRRVMTSTMVELRTFLADEQLHGKLDKVVVGTIQLSETFVFCSILYGSLERTV